MTVYCKRTPVSIWFVLIALCISLTLLDILVVETFYRPTQAWDRIITWHIIYRTIFIITPMIAVHIFRNLAPLATWFFFIFGIEDTLFYALQGYLPTQFLGVYVLWFWEPALNMVLQANLLGLLTILMFGIFASKKQIA